MLFSLQTGNCGFWAFQNGWRSEQKQMIAGATKDLVPTLTAVIENNHLFHATYVDSSHIWLDTVPSHDWVR